MLFHSKVQNIACLTAVLASFLSPGFSGSGEKPRIFAITEATIVTAPGKRIEKGTLVIRNGLIESVGAKIAVPADAVEINGAGLTVYPGLVDVLTTLGLNQPETLPAPALPPPVNPMRPRERQETPTGAVHALNRVHAEKQARDLLAPFSEQDKDALNYRNMGFTSVLVAPDKGIFRGESTLINLKENAPASELILKDRVAQHIAFEHGGFGQGYPSSLMGTAAAIRQVLLDTDRYVTWKTRYQSSPAGMRRPDYNSTFEALTRVLNRSTPVFFQADHNDDILLAARLSQEFKLRTIIAGTGHEWEMLDQPKNLNTPLVLPVAFPIKPKVEEADESLNISLRDLRRYAYAAENPARLHKAGIKFALTTHGLRNLADFPKNMKKIVDAGLPAEVALAALTTVPAEMLGVSATLGTLEPDKIANLFVTDGPLFAEKTKVKLVFVDGLEYKIEEEKKPKGDPNAIVDPRGTWSVVLEFPNGRSVTRLWKIRGTRGAYSGTAETRRGTVEFSDVRLEGNMLTVVLTEGGSGRSGETTVIISGDSFEGSMQQGSMNIPIHGTRTSGPERGGQ